MKRKRAMLHLVLAISFALAACPAIAQYTLFDDGAWIYNGTAKVLDPAVEDVYYDQGGRGRPGIAGTPYTGPYNGQEYLTIWADLQGGRWRYATRIAAYIRNDVGLDNSQDWWIKLDITNDRLAPDAGIYLFLLTFKPDEAIPETKLLNNVASVIDGRRTFMAGICDQNENDTARGGLWLEALKTSALGGRVGISPFRLDPDPDESGMRTGHNYFTIEWFAESKVFKWTASNVNGSWQVVQPASELAEFSGETPPAETYIALGSPDNQFLPMGAAWTIWDVDMAQGRLTTAPFSVELGGEGTATVGGNAVADGAEYFGGLPLHGVATGASDASFVKTAALGGTEWTVHGVCESTPGTTYSHQLMTSAWSGQPEAYSGVPSTLMAQILQAADGSVAFSYVNLAGAVMTWNQATKAWEAGSHVLDITLDGGGNDEWWVAYDGTNYWLCVTNGPQARTVTIPASSVRGGGASCLFSAGRPWTTGWGLADFTIFNLDLLPYFSDPPLSTGPFIVELAGGATAIADGFPVSDGGTWSGSGEIWATGTNGATDAAIVKTPPLGRHPWTVSFYFAALFADNNAFAAEVKDTAWSGEPGPFTGWPGNNKFMIRCEDAGDNGQAIYWNPAGVAHWYDMWSGPWPTTERMLEFGFAELPFDFPRIQVAIGYDGDQYHFLLTDGENKRIYSAPNGTPDPMREQNTGSYLVLGDAYTDMNPCEFRIQNATMVPYFDRTLFPYWDPGTYVPPQVSRIVDVEQTQNGRHVRVPNQLVSMYADAPGIAVYFIQERDRSAGIAVLGGGEGIVPGTVRTVTGIVGEQGGERVIFQYGMLSLNVGTEDAPEPLGVTGRTLGGGPQGLVKGVELGTGLNNLGLLVRTTGIVTYVGSTYFLLDDGSAIADDPNGMGVRVQSPAALASPPASGSYVAVTGAARPYVRSDEKLGREIMISGPDDIQVLQAAP